ncbi:hypothetical protein [Chakrabartyella piscis]|uniref:hypothetical protein n=1 Tax=Chakrabartyella piscis TaxID=2918914 RepID=UPI0029588EAB|nr:hypothetical protein [Chakrabartyella piscis]
MKQIVKAIFTWEGIGEVTAKSFVSQYEKKGFVVEMYGTAHRDDLIAIGTEQKATHVLHFLDVTNVVLVSLADEFGGFTVEITTNDLQ